MMHILFFKGYIHTCKELGEGAPATSQPKYCNCNCRKQSRPGKQESCRFPGNEEVLRTIAEARESFGNYLTDYCEFILLAFFFFFRKHKHMPMTTVCSSWKPQLRLQ